MHRNTSFAVAAALAASILLPAGAMAMTPVAVNGEAMPALSLIQKTGDRDDRDHDRGRRYDRDDDRGDRYDRDRGRGDHYDRGDRGRGWGHGWRNRCRFVRRECAYRFDWGSWRFRRCVVRRGCW